MVKEKFVEISDKKFYEIYEQNNGFNDEFNKNHPAYREGENFFDFILSGARILTKEEFESVVKS